MPGFRINNEGVGPSAAVEVSRVHRWRLSFDAIGAFNDVVMYAQSAERPSVEINVDEFHNRQTMAWIAGKHRWNPIDVVLYEIVEGLPATTASELFNYWAMDPNTSVVDTDTNTLNRNYKAHTCLIEMLDGRGDDAGVMHRYKLYNVWPSNIRPGELTYEESSLATTRITFHYDQAEEFV